MKNVTSCIKLLPVLLIAVLVSCNSGTDKKAAGDTVTAAKPSAPAVLKEEMIIKHKVANYAKWLPLYEGDSSMRSASGIHDHVIARGTEDSNTVLLVFYIDDAAKAKAFGADPRLKDVMKKAGISSAPEIDYIHRVMTDTSATDQTARVMIRHKVKDWDAWKKVFDEDKSARMAAGLSDKMVGYSVDDNHMVTIICIINDAAKAKAFMNDKRLADKMKAGGIEGAPSIFFYHIVQKKG